MRVIFRLLDVGLGLYTRLVGSSCPEFRAYDGGSFMVGFRVGFADDKPEVAVKTVPGVSKLSDFVIGTTK